VKLQRQQTMYQFITSGSTIQVTASRNAPDKPPAYTVTVINGNKHGTIENTTETALKAALEAIHLAKTYAETGSPTPVEDWPTPISPADRDAALIAERPRGRNKLFRT